MSNTNQIILFGKYSIIKELGHGAYSTVYLAKHLTLDVLRAIKVMPKGNIEDSSILSEAKLLKSLKHKGIPFIFDIEEDNDNFYLIEEYICGDTLGDFLLHQKRLSSSLFISFCKQLGDIFTYLHTAREQPIFYQDLKPEHIYVVNNQLKLIDFGLSNLNSLDNSLNLLGNEEFSAPELFSREKITIQSDVYTLGKLFEYLLGFVEDSIYQQSIHSIYKAIDFNPTCRYETVDEFLNALMASFNNSSQMHLIKKIAVVGASKGCGCTHFSISATSCLNFLGYNALYFEKNNTNALLNLSNHIPNSKENEGVISYKCFNGLPNYGPGIKIDSISFQYGIYDFGSSFSVHELKNYDLILLIFPRGEWLFNDAIENFSPLISNINSNKLKFICNLGNSKDSLPIAKFFKAPVFPYDYDSDLFLSNQKKEEFFSQVLQLEGRKKRFLDFVKRKK